MDQPSPSKQRRFEFENDRLVAIAEPPTTQGDRPRPGNPSGIPGLVAQYGPTLENVEGIDYEPTRKKARKIPQVSTPGTVPSKKVTKKTPGQLSAQYP